MLCYFLQFANWSSRSFWIVVYESNKISIDVKSTMLDTAHISEDLRGLRPYKRKRSHFVYVCRFLDASIVENLEGLVAAVNQVISSTTAVRRSRVLDASTR